MDSIRKTPLQAELERIERDAKAHSLAIMHKADDLNSAAHLCDLLNAGLPPEKQVKPCVIYIDENSADISIYVRPGDGVAVLRQASEIELCWQDNGETYNKTRDLRFHSFERIEVRVRSSDIAAFHESVMEAA
jgi:hypothetical protein